MIVNVFCEGDDVFDQNDNAVRSLLPFFWILGIFFVRRWWLAGSWLLTYFRVTITVLSTKTPFLRSVCGSQKHTLPIAYPGAECGSIIHSLHVHSLILMSSLAPACDWQKGARRHGSAPLNWPDSERRR